MQEQRLIFNNDGTFILANGVHGGRPLTPEDVRDYVDLVAGTAVTSFFICTNSSMPYYKSRLERSMGCLGDRVQRDDDRSPHEGDNCALYGRNIMALHEKGTDIVELCVNRAHEQKMEAFATMRMNDLHFTDPDLHYPVAQADFWLDHPEYYLNDRGIGWHANGALDFAHEEVRRYKLDMIEEICTRFNIDGLDLDWMRFPAVFGCGEGERNTDTMTGFMREARAITRRAGEARGRKIMLVTRLPRCMEHCRRLGFDPATWINEESVDFVTVTAFLCDTQRLPVAEFRAALGDADRVPVYAGIDATAGRDYRPTWCETRTHGMFRSVAVDRYRGGADGLYLFNCFFTTPEDRVEGMSGLGAARSLLSELADPEVLRRKNKRYILDVRTDEFGYSYYHELPQAMVVGMRKALWLQVTDDVAKLQPERAVLLTRTDGTQAPGLHVSMNGELLGPPAEHDMVAKLRGDWGLAGEQEVLAWEVPVSAVRQGDNGIIAWTEKDADILQIDLCLFYGDPRQYGWL